MGKAVVRGLPPGLTILALVVCFAGQCVTQLEGSVAGGQRAATQVSGEQKPIPGHPEALAGKARQDSPDQHRPWYEKWSLILGLVVSAGMILAAIWRFTPRVWGRLQRQWSRFGRFQRMLLARHEIAGIVAESYSDNMPLGELQSIIEEEYLQQPFVERGHYVFDMEIHGFVWANLLPFLNRWSRRPQGSRAGDAWRKAMEYFAGEVRSRNIARISFLHNGINNFLANRIGRETNRSLITAKRDEALVGLEGVRRDDPVAVVETLLLTEGKLIGHIRALQNAGLRVECVLALADARTVGGESQLEAVGIEPARVARIMRLDLGLHPVDGCPDPSGTRPKPIAHEDF